MKKQVLTWVALLCLTLNATAQKDSVLTKLDHVYQHIDMSQVPSGILYDKGYSFVNPYQYQHPEPDSVQTGPDEFRLLYASLFSAKASRVTLPELSSLNSQIDAMPHNVVPIGLVDIDFSFLRDDALDLGLVRVENEVVIPLSTNQSSLFLGDNAQMVSALRPVVDGLGVTFSFPGFLNLRSADGKSQPTVKLDVGSGWQTLALDGTMPATFSSEGSKTILYKIENAGGPTRQGSFQVFVVNVPDQVTAGDDIDPTMLHSGGRVHIAYASGTTLSRPVLIVLEGVDYAQIAPDIITFGNWTWANSASKLDQLLFFQGPITGNAFLNSQYDIVYLDWNQGADDITRNA